MNFMTRGATRPFLVEDEKNLKWVVKVIGNPFGAQAVFNELIAGRLAELIGLPWPRVAIVELSANIVDTIGRNGLNATSQIAVGTEYIFGLTPGEFPDDFDIADKTKNASYIHRLFPNDKMIESFYGKSIFDNWILLLNDTKYDTLQISPNGEPIFLDATFALGYFDTDWEEGKLFWRDTALNLELSPYLSGVVTDTGRYQNWIKNISNISREDIDKILHSIPIEWAVPDRYLSALRQFIGSTPEVFVPLFKDYLDFMNYAG